MTKNEKLTLGALLLLFLWWRKDRNIFGDKVSVNLNVSDTGFPSINGDTILQDGVWPPSTD